MTDLNDLQCTTGWLNLNNNKPSRGTLNWKLAKNQNGNDLLPVRDWRNNIVSAFDTSSETMMGSAASYITERRVTTHDDNCSSVFSEKAADCVPYITQDRTDQSSPIQEAWDRNEKPSGESLAD